MSGHNEWDNVFGMTTLRRSPWKTKNPKPTKERTVLTKEFKDLAKARAEGAGRKYPNLIDNMWAAAEQNAKAKKKSKSSDS
jgi:hypothetical protein